METLVTISESLRNLAANGRGLAFMLGLASSPLLWSLGNAVRKAYREYADLPSVSPVGTTFMQDNGLM